MVQGERDEYRRKYQQSLIGKDKPEDNSQKGNTNEKYMKALQEIDSKDKEIAKLKKELQEFKHGYFEEKRNKYL